MTAFTNLIEIIAGHAWLTALAFSAIYLLLLSIYRLFFHPLAKFPGPKFAALTVWYEFYYDGLKRGQYGFEIGKMHERYGPIVRISPDELHVNDPAFIDTLYAGGGKRRDKYEYFTSQFGIPKSVFATVSHDLHRLRRGALNRYFSKASVTKLEPTINQVVQKLCAQIEKHAGSGNAVTLSSAFSCMTTDVVTEYAFARSYDFLSTDSPGFETNLHEAILAGSEIGLFVKQFPWMLRILQALPPVVVGKLNPTMKSYLTFQKDIKAQIQEVKQSLNQGSEKAGTTIFHELLTGNLPNEEKSVERLWQEGQIIVGAGTETTAWTISAIMYYVLAQPETFSKLSKELEAAIPDPAQLPALTVLEQLPYLICLPSESLRLSYGVSTRSQRVLPQEALIFKTNKTELSDSFYWPSDKSRDFVEYKIPPGTPVSMTSVLVHHNPALFPNPKTFIPERWIDEKGQRRRDLEGYLLSFSKGSRQCLGINLAYAEVYLALAAVIRNFGDRLELFETTAEDVEIHHDVFVPVPKVGSKGIRVLVKQK
ncbi:oxoglutarate/iron-dependent oxygenase [Tricladium varicosporioides]|nr:oxoglutarate/iron-dependent oxygenase [Hymenoscyphus varicosporioides]